MLPVALRHREGGLMVVVISGRDVSGEGVCVCDWRWWGVMGLGGL